MPLTLNDLVAPTPVTHDTFPGRIEAIMNDDRMKGRSLLSSVGDEPFLDCLGAITGVTGTIASGAALFAAGNRPGGRHRILTGLLVLSLIARELAEGLGYVTLEPTATEPEPIVDMVGHEEDDDEDGEPEPFGDRVGGVEVVTRDGRTKLVVNLDLDISRLVSPARLSA